MAKLTATKRTNLVKFRNQFESLIADWNYDEYPEVLPFIESLKTFVHQRQTTLYGDFIRDSIIERHKRQEKKQQRDQLTTKVARQWGSWLVGRIVRVSGTRDGTGVRRVIAVDLSRNEIRCEQLEVVRRTIRKPRFDCNSKISVAIRVIQGAFRVRGITTQALSRITHIDPEMRHSIKTVDSTIDSDKYSICLNPFVIEQ